MNIKKNYLYNLLYQLLTVSLPLITVPYVSRVLGSNGVGIFAYTSSIVQYFCLFAMLGIGIYGNQRIATIRDNKIKLSETFFSIYFLQLIMSALSVIVYILFLIFFVKSNKFIATIQIINLLASAIDCSWLFSGLEQFRKIVIRNITIKIFSLLLVFILVKEPGDLPAYTYIMCLATFFGQLVMWTYVRKSVKFKAFSINKITEHIKPTLSYFIPQIAIQIYFILDKTMIGILSTKSEVGIYEYADKILKISLAFVTSLGTVMLPRVANTYSKGDINKVNEYLSKSLDFSTLISIPIMFGIAGIAKEFIPWYLGKDFYGSIYVLSIISPTILLMSWSGVFGTQYLLPLGQMKYYSISVYTGAVVNLVINYVLIRHLGSIGAAVGTLSAEFAVTTTQLFFVRKNINFKFIIGKLTYYLFAGILMFLVLRLLGSLLTPSIVTTFTQIIIGGLIYITLILIIESSKKEGLFFKEMMKIKSKILEKVS